MKSKEYKAIVESGSTKSDFVIFNSENQIELRTQIMGFNPIFNSMDEKIEALNGVQELKAIAPFIQEIEFYGAGCSNESLKDKINAAFKTFFENASCQVHSDIMAACKAVFQGKSCLVGILGTGSNICFYDGENVTKLTPSLGYVLGDEGSGNHLGKYLLRAYFTKKLPPHLVEKLEEKYDLNVADLIERVYRQSRANTYLAQFNTFLHENREDDYIQNLIQESFEDYYVYQIMPYLELDFEEINFVGSIAYLYRDMLEKLMVKHGLKLGRVIQSPMDELVRRVGSSFDV